MGTPYSSPCRAKCRDNGQEKGNYYSILGLHIGIGFRDHSAEHLWVQDWVGEGVRDLTQVHSRVAPLQLDSSKLGSLH